MRVNDPHTAPRVDVGKNHILQESGFSHARFPNAVDVAPAVVIPDAEPHACTAEHGLSEDREILLRIRIPRDGEIDGRLQLAGEHPVDVRRLHQNGRQVPERGDFLRGEDVRGDTEPRVRLLLLNYFPGLEGIALREGELLETSRHLRKLPEPLHLLPFGVDDRYTHIAQKEQAVHLIQRCSDGILPVVRAHAPGFLLVRIGGTLITAGGGRGNNLEELIESRPRAEPAHGGRKRHVQELLPSPRKLHAGEEVLVGLGEGRNALRKKRQGPDGAAPEPRAHHGLHDHLHMPAHAGYIKPRESRRNARNGVHVHAGEHVIELGMPLDGKHLRIGEDQIEGYHLVSLPDSEGIHPRTLYIHIRVLRVELALRQLCRTLARTDEEGDLPLRVPDLQIHLLILAS
ncbi:MAG: hypothetical protein UY90_C0013G0011 [Candidatus Peregrinibacteria bacterium GW2011_GWA2_54_9]|nr:MAG: hypothetical protein UY90_C0013G0011 [Candidatus Peregrinibacteria bacterium GW2011_GWA2_54_9]